MRQRAVARACSGMCSIAVHPQEIGIFVGVFIMDAYEAHEAPPYLRYYGPINLLHASAGGERPLATMHTHLNRPAPPAAWAHLNAGGRHSLYDSSHIS